MTYTALYRRYRPDRFDALVGQEHVARVLAAAARKGGFVHAYLFCGPRGTGKTSAARILARAINCRQLTEEGEPCNECDSCRRALTGAGVRLAGGVRDWIRGAGCAWPTACQDSPLRDRRRLSQDARRPDRQKGSAITQIPFVRPAAGRFDTCAGSR